MEIIFSLVIGLAVIAAVGRLLWALAAALLGLLISLGRNAGILPTPKCTWCGGGLPALSSKCKVCGNHQGDRYSQVCARDIAASVRMLNRLHRLSHLSDEEYTKWRSTLRSEWERIQGVERSLEDLTFRDAARPEPIKSAVPVPPVAEAMPARPSRTEPKPAMPPAAAIGAGAVERIVPEETAPTLAPVGARHAAAAPPATEVVPVEPAAPAAAPAAPAPPRRALADLLQAFMEEKNIRWGELVSGMLIVGCSIGLVVSLWSTLESIPYFPAFLFMSATVCIHAAGLYTLRRWRLESVSWTLIVIAQLLVPLNVLTFLALAKRMPAGDAFFLIGLGFVLVVFGYSTYSAGRSLMPQWRLFLVITVLGPSLWQALISRQVTPALSPPLDLAFGAVPLLLYWIGALRLYVAASRWEAFDGDRLRQLFLALALSTFALVLADGLLVYKIGDVLLATNRLAPLVSLTAVPALALGLLLHRRLGGIEQAAARMTGTTLAMLGVAVLLLALGCAWPHPYLLTAVGLVNFVVLSILAARNKFAVLHLFALPCLAAAYLVGVQSLYRPFDFAQDLSAQLTERFLAGSSSVFLFPLAVLLEAASILLGRFRRLADRWAYGIIAAVLAGVNLALAAYAGFLTRIEATGVTGVFAGYALVALVLAWWFRRPALSWTSSGLLLVALGHGLLFNNDLRGRLVVDLPLALDRPLLTALLLHTSILTLLALSARVLARRRRGDAATQLAALDLIGPLEISAVSTSLLSLLHLQSYGESEIAQLAGLFTWVSGIWLILAFCRQSARLLTAFQALGTIAVMLTVTAICQRQPWWNGLDPSAQDPRYFEAQGCALLGYSLAWMLARWFAALGSFAEAWFRRAWLFLDWFLLEAVLFVVYFLVVVGCLPGIRSELAVGWTAGIELAWQSAGISPVHAYGWGAWEVFGLLLLTTGLALLFERRQLAGKWALGAALPNAVLQAVSADATAASQAIAAPAAALAARARAILALCNLALVGSIAAWLLAGPAQADQTTASRLRWYLAAYGLLVAGLGWLLRARAAASADGLISTGTVTPGHWARWCNFAVTALPIGLFSAVAVGQAWAGELPELPGGTSMSSRVLHTLGPALNYALPLLALTLVFAGYGLADRLAADAVVGGLVLNFAVSVAYCLPIWLSGRLLDYANGAAWLQWNVAACALYGLVWLALCWRRQARTDRSWMEPVPDFSLALGTMAQLALAAMAVARIWQPLVPTGPVWEFVRQTGAWQGWLALVVLVFFAGLAWYRSPSAKNVQALAILVLCVTVLVPSTVAAWGAGLFVTYRWLILGWPTAGLLLVGLGTALDRWRTVPEAATDSTGFHDRRRIIVAAAVAACMLTVAQTLFGIPVAALRPWAAGACWVAALCLFALAAWNRAEGFAWAASLVSNGAASLVAFHLHTDQSLDEWFILLLQINLAAYAGAALAWLALERWIYPVAPGAAATGSAEPVLPDSTRRKRPLLELQLGATVWGNCLLAGAAALRIFLWPDEPSALVQQVGASAGFIACAVAALASAAYFRAALARRWAHLACWFGLLAGCLVAARTHAAAGPTAWFSYHVLTTGWLVVAWLAALGTWLLALDAYRRVANQRGAAGETALGQSAIAGQPPWEQWGLASVAALITDATQWATAIGTAVLVLAVRGSVDDPARPAWSMGAAAAVFFLLVCLGLRGRSQTYAYGSIAAAAMAVSCLWIERLTSHAYVTVQAGYAVLAVDNLLAIALVGGLWLGVELWWQRRRQSSFDPGYPSAPSHHFALGLAVVGLTLLVGTALNLRLVGAGGWDAELRILTGASAWSLLFAAAAGILGLFWDRRARHVVAVLYFVGILANLLANTSVESDPRELLFAIGIVSAAYVFLVGVLWSARDSIGLLAQMLAVPTTESDITLTARWLPAAQSLLTGFMLAIATWVSLTFDPLVQRLEGSAAAGLAAVGLTLSLAGLQRRRYQVAALLLGALAVVDAGWALTPPSAAPDLWLHRTIRLFVTLSLATVLTGFVLTRLVRSIQSWYQSARLAGMLTGVAALAALAGTLALEAAWFRANPLRLGAPVTAVEIAVVLLALVGLVVVALRFAVLPGADPLGLTERGRMAYVFVAEVVLTLLFVHCKLTMPTLFGGLWERYWPLMIMLVAYAGVGLSELFRRIGQRVLAEPLERTGAFLPLLPALGFWVQSSQTNYSAVLFTVGLLYAVLSMARKSFIFGVAAALAGNGALWVLLHEHGTSMLRHPQLWLIPPALSVLAAAYINRDRLAEAQMTAIRYLCVMIIYVSSTADMFIASSGGQVPELWLPIVLTVLSVLGVLAGIALRVRAFLYLGSTFLLLSLTSMVGQAARNIGHVWPWWAFGIVLGLAILTMFGIFENRRNEVLRLVNELRQWER